MKTYGYLNGPLVLLLVGTMMLQGCAAAEKAVEQPAKGCLDKRMEASEAAKKAQQPSAEDVDSFKTLKVNESGEVMIIMYHRIATKNTTYDRTAVDFASDLERLHVMGFQPVSMWDYVNGTFDVPKGKTPYVLTFDDGSISNFKVTGLDGSGKPIIDPNCAIGLMEAFEMKHPEVEMKATFFLNAGVPFEQKEYADYKVKWLLENGYEIGNHSYGHENFKKLNAAQVEESLGKNNNQLLERIAKANIPDSLNAQHGIYALALPFGSRPAEEHRYVLEKGTYSGKTYAHKAVLNVGWKPGSSPYAASNDPASLHRVQCGDGEMQLSFWLDGYEKNPEKRFISDGRPEWVVIPESSTIELKSDWKTKVFPY